MAQSSDVFTDWQKSAGDFSCVVCGRKRLPASEFSKKSVEKMLESLKTLESRDIRADTDSSVQSVTFLSGTCKKCTEEKEEKERAEAAARRADRDDAAKETIAEPPTRSIVSFSDRPFGMVTSKAEGVGYLVAKASDGKPAAKSGVKAGWRVVGVAGSNCDGQSLEEIQALLKAADLPVNVEFEQVPSNADFCTSCHRVSTDFSRKMRTKPVEKRRCTACVEAAGEKEAAGAEGGEADAAPTTKMGELQALCADSAKQAETVTGLKAVRGGGYSGRGKGRGKR